MIKKEKLQNKILIDEISIEEKYKQINELFIHAKRPLFVFDDDTDGLSAFLLLYKKYRRGDYFILKTTPDLGMPLAEKLQDYTFDLLVILDIAIIRQEFFDSFDVPIIWIDHHSPCEFRNDTMEDFQIKKEEESIVEKVTVEKSDMSDSKDTENISEKNKVLYLNPRQYGYNIPTTALCYNVVQENEWIGMIGAIGDWHFPSFGKKFIEQYSFLLPEEMAPEEVMHKSRIGTLVRLISFNLRGDSRSVRKSIHILTKINDPLEILDGTTEEGRYLYDRYAELNKEFEKLVERAIRKKDEEPLIFLYEESQTSFTADLANELQYRFPEKFIIVGRSKSGSAKCSLRCSYLNLQEVLKTAMTGVSGTGGGHEFAVGVVIQDDTFPIFVENIKKIIEEKKEEEKKVKSK